MAERKSVVSKVTKTLLKNVIRHTDTHNRIVEESEMWRQRGKELKKRQGSVPSYSEDRHVYVNQRGSGSSFLQDRGADMNEEYRSRSRYQAHMDEEPHSTFWMRQLYKVEEADSNRWGHSGFKQLYPEQFEESDSLTSDNEQSLQSHRKKKRHKEHRSIKDLQDSHRKEKRRKRKHSSSSSDSESHSQQEEKKTRKKHKHKHKKKKKKHKKEKRETNH